MATMQRPVQPNNVDSSLMDFQVAVPMQQPQDSVSDIQFSPADPTMFAAATWDGKIIIYRIQSQQGFNGAVQGQVAQVAQLQYNEAITCIAWRSDGVVIYAGCSDNTVRAFNLQTNSNTQIGQHQAGIKSIFFVQQLNNAVITCSFDTFVCFWSESSPNNPLAKIQLRAKIFAADCVFPVLALGLQGEVVTFINLQMNIAQLNPSQIAYQDSPLGKGSQINVIKLFSKGNGFGIGSIDGRANLGKLSAQVNTITFKIDNIMTFKCHKTEEKQGTTSNQILYPVNSMCFNARADYFLLTSGSDGCMYFWDFENKNKIKSFTFNKQPVSAANVSSNGQFIAYALSYDWHLGYEYSAQFDKPRICVHFVAEDELKFKK